MLAALLLAAALGAPAAAAPPAAPAKGPAKPAAAPAPKGLDPVMTVREAEARLREALDAGAGQAQLSALAAEYVDYEDLARRSLGKDWARQAKADQAALVKALRALLEATYLARLQPGAAGRAEVSLASRKGPEAELRVLAVGADREVPIELRVHLGKDGRWRVWDATVAGLALLEGYQEQFPQLLALGGMKRLLAQLEQERQAELARRAPPPAPAAPPAPQPPR